MEQEHMIEQEHKECTLLITKLVLNDKNYLATALYQEKQLQEISLECEDTQSILGNIYVGRVRDVVKNLNAAFIEIMPGLCCYFDLDDLKNPLYVKKINSPRMVQGDEVVVQVARESSKRKPPRVSTKLNFSGKYIVLTNEHHSVFTSRKLDAETKARLKETLELEKSDDFGIIVRTNAAHAAPEEIEKEYEELKQEYLNLKETACHRTAYSCLRKEMPEYLHVLQDMREGQMDAVITDDREIYEQVGAYLERFPQQDCVLKYYEDPMLSLSKLYSLELRIQEALRERVWMKSGGYLVIQPTEALTVIDVNSGKSVAKKKEQEHYLKINLEAAGEVAHQMRLRNLSGMIVVDFINMESEEDNELLLKTLREYVRADRVPTQIWGLTKLNLVEITRKKVKKPLAELINEKKP